MSRVFVAHDKSLDRKVVVKVMAPEIAGPLSAERFKLEIMVSAGLQHPNIIGVISAGEADGVPYFVMPYVEGESLRALLKRELQVPVRRVRRSGHGGRALPSTSSSWGHCESTRA
jgi:serine/threonine-protein kinase